ncbi:uncharacterized protein [Aristolochia californica]|uniref:uncharacterized protein n=1 Tax=Aristolochia californica TaxID=171875 RepID=UPI0035DC0044
MDPLGFLTAKERQWIEEVHYLHSLWRQGPPRTGKVNLGPQSSVAFKPENKLKTKKEKKAKKKKDTILASQTQQEPFDNHPVSTVSEVEWPLNPVPEEPQEIGWPSQTQNSQVAAATGEELAKLSSIQMQKEAVKLCRDFFKKESSDGEDDKGEPTDEDSDSISEHLDFFLRLFAEDAELRGYYEKHWEKGEFSCLVCGGIGVKLGKKFGNCVALVQHSISISKTTKRASHRAFGQALCRVLGWEISRLPTIVLSLGEPLSRTLDQAAPQNASLAQNMIISADVVHIDNIAEESKNTDGPAQVVNLVEKIKD